MWVPPRVYPENDRPTAGYYVARVVYRVPGLTWSRTRRMAF